MMWADWIRRCARRVAMRRVSWTDQRMSDFVGSESGGSGFAKRQADWRGGEWLRSWRRPYPSADGRLALSISPP